MRKKRLKAYISGITLIMVFILISYFVNKNINYLQENISGGYLSMIIYFVAVNLEIIFAPVTLIPIIPLASAIFGNFTSFMLTWIGWTLGSVIAFIIARHIGVPIFEKIVSVKELEKYRRFIPDKNLFLGVLFLRLFLPLDIISYALGFFTKIDLKRYTLATLIGFAPIIFILSYFGEIPMTYKIIWGIIGLISIIAIIIFNKKLKSLFIRVFKIEV